MHKPGTATAAFLAALTISTASAEEKSERVEGYFCDSRADYLAFLAEKAAGENDIMAANAVNKAAKRMSCAPYLPARAVATGEHTVMDGGLVYRLHSYKFLPEQVERWSGTVFGSLGGATNTAKQDI